MTLLDWTGKVIEAKAATGPWAGRVEHGSYLFREARTPQALMRLAQAAYHRNPWVGSAEATVTRRVSGLPWHLEDEADEEYAEPYPPAVKAAFDLLERPQKMLPPETRDPGLLTRRALISITSRHIGLCGMAYWFLDQMDTNGIPVAILYVNPARVWAATTGQGRIIGWVLDPQDEQGHGGTPLTLSELLPFYLDPPDTGPYGSGLYERAMLKAQITTLADQHAAYVLSTGGRLSGIVSPKEGVIPDEQYKTLVSEFRNLTDAPDAAKRTTILRGPIDFTRTVADSTELGLPDLSKMNRDDIFAVWGVPPSQAGVPSASGLNSGETRKYDEATLMQGAVHDRIVSIRETIQYGLLDRWQEIGTTIDLEIVEPEFDDRTPMFDLAVKARDLPLTNAERRELIGLPPFSKEGAQDARDEEVWLPGILQNAYPPEPTIPAPLIPFEPFKASRREYLGLRKTLDVRWVPAMRKTLGTLLQAQRAEVAAKVRAASPGEFGRQRKNLQHWFDRDKEATRLRKILQPVAASLAETVVKRAQQLLGKADPFTDSVVSSVIRKVGSRVVGITQTTQDAIAAAIAKGFEDGLSPSQVGDLIENLPAFDEARAELVARTEMMFAYNDAALDSYTEFGITEVEAIDGDQDEECAARDGQTFSIEEAEGITDHPNGTLDWVPIIGKAQQADSQIMALLTALMAQKSETNFQVLLPETLAIPAPIVNVAAPEVHVAPTEVHVAAPVVHVAAPSVTVEARPAMRTVIDYTDGIVTGEHEEPV